MKHPARAANQFANVSTFQIIEILRYIRSQINNCMIQRIQTIYLFAIIILALVTCSGQIIDFQERIATATKVAPVTDATTTAPVDTVFKGKAVAYTLNAVYFNTYVNGDLQESRIQYGLIIIVSLIIGWTLNIILGFKNRKKQLLHTKINFVLIGAYLAAVLAKAFVQIPNFTFTGMTIKASLGLALIIFMLYLNLRALLLIKRDEELVKSADRLR